MRDFFRDKLRPLSRNTSIIRLRQRTSWRLVLPFNNDPIGDTGIINLTKNPNIQSFAAINSNIGDAGATALAAEPLFTLNVSQNNITSVGIKALSSNQSIYSLYIENNKFDQEGVVALAAEKH